MVGLDAAGKTTILYKLKLGEIVTTIPTIGEFSANASFWEVSRDPWIEVVGSGWDSPLEMDGLSRCRR